MLKRFEGIHFKHLHSSSCTHAFVGISTYKMVDHYITSWCGFWGGPELLATTIVTRQHPQLFSGYLSLTHFKNTSPSLGES